MHDPISMKHPGNSLQGRWLGLSGFSDEGMGSSPSWGNKIPQAAQHGQKKKGKKDVSNIQTGVNRFLLSNWLCRVNVLDTGS